MAASILPAVLLDHLTGPVKDLKAARLLPGRPRDGVRLRDRGEDHAVLIAGGGLLDGRIGRAWKVSRSDIVEPPGERRTPGIGSGWSPSPGKALKQIHTDAAAGRRTLLAHRC
jgi:hypothetical protein